MKDEEVKVNFRIEKEIARRLKIFCAMKEMKQQQAFREALIRYLDEEERLNC